MDILAIGSLMMLVYTLITSLWILFNSTTASRLLLLYEDATKKAAKVTSKAAEQLRRTRMTQTAGVVASVSTTTSALLGLYFTFTTTASDNVARRNLFFMGAVNAALCLWVRRYMARFWAGSARIPLPGSTEYNDAVRATEQVMKGLKTVAMGWASIMAVNWDWS